MFYISEWLPNPKGTDRGAEWVEIGNNGDASASLSGWSLTNGASKKVALQGDVPAHGFVLIPVNEQGLTIRNTNESIFLFDPSGNLAHESHFFGTAPEGKSYSSINGQFVVSDPTPGAENPATAGSNMTALVGATYPESGVVESSLGGGGIVGLALMAALAVTALFIFIITQHDDIQKLVFARDEEIR